MSKGAPNRIATNDRSMDTDKADRSEMFFFPKRNPPVSIRATSREEAEALLDNQKEV